MSTSPEPLDLRDDPPLCCERGKGSPGVTETGWSGNVGGQRGSPGMWREGTPFTCGGQKPLPSQGGG